MKRILILVLMITINLFAQFGRQQYFQKLGNDSLGLAYGFSKLKVDSMIYIKDGGLRYFNGQFQFSNNLVNWFNIPTSLPTGGGWTWGLNKIYQATAGDKIHIRQNAGDTTGTALFNVYGHSYFAGSLNIGGVSLAKLNLFSNSDLVRLFSSDTTLAILRIFTNATERARIGYATEGLLMANAINGLRILGIDGLSLGVGSSAVINITSSGNVGFRTTNPTAIVDINGTTGYNQLRLRTSYTPTSSLDPNGNVGDITWDNNYIYVKTSLGWRRAPLSLF